MTREKIKTKDIHIRISEDELQMLKNKADSVKLSLTDYLTYCGIGKQIFVVEGLEELNRQHRALGNNINQLARLANSGQVNVIGLDEFLTEYQSIGKSIIELLDRKRWR
ncbi:MAG: MobC family plasmid mobilization relaxosome protein [Saccharofermentans sp.]|nr:MobC family plasmid mobilization relaxosome protein [Saccharofermentans sp.]